MKRILLLTLFAGGFFLSFTTFSWALDDPPQTQTNVGDVRGLEHAPPPGRLAAPIHHVSETTTSKIDTNPDDWGEGEVILGGDPKDNKRAKKILGEEAKRERERKAEQEERKAANPKVEELKARLKAGGYEKGWFLYFDENSEPYIGDNEGVRIEDPDGASPSTQVSASDNSDPDAWGQKEKIL